MGKVSKAKSAKRVVRVSVIKKETRERRPLKKLQSNRSRQHMSTRVVQRKTSLKKDPVKKPAARAKTPKSFLHKMLTAEGWKRLMMGKTAKK